jgi:hypothetical protein
VLGSAFAEQFRASPLGEALRNAPETRKLNAFAELLRNHLDVEWTRVRDQILGDCVVLAYRPGPPGKPEQEQGVLLLRAGDATLLANVLDRLNEVQKKAGDLKELKARRHQGKEYFCRVLPHEVQFYYLNGPVLAFTSREELLQRVMGLEGEGAAAESWLARQLSRLGAAGDLATLWVNPRAFDAQLAEKAAHAQAGEATVLKTFLGYWQAVDGVALTASLNKGALEGRLAVQVREEKLPPAGRTMAAGEARASELWGCFPADAVLAVAGTVDAVAVTDLVSEFLPEEARKGLREAVDRGAAAALGRDVAKEVLPFLGPDWGFCVAAPPAGDRDWFPHVLWALRVRPGDNEKPLDQVLLDALNSAAILGVLGYNNSHPDPLSLKTVTQDKVEVKYLANDRGFPPGLQPAFAFKSGYLVLASSPAALRRFNPPASAGSAITPGGEVPLVRLSVRELCRFLKDRRQMLAVPVAEKHKLSREEAGLRLDRLVSSLQLFDRLELSRRVTPGQVTLVLRLRTAQPLK